MPAVPYNLFPRMDLGMTISNNEFHVYKRGDIDVVYEWVNKIFDLTNSEKTFYEISQDYHSAFPHPSKMKTVMYESPLNTHWMFYNDNSHLFWGIPWDRPRRIERRRNTHLEIIELDYQRGNRKLNIFSPDGSPFGSEFSLRQMAKQMEKQAAIRAKVQRAASYPIFVLVLAVAVSAVAHGRCIWRAQGLRISPCTLLRALALAIVWPLGQYLGGRPTPSRRDGLEARAR